METVKIKHFCKLPVLMKLLLAIGLPLYAWLLIAGISNHITALIVLGVIIIIPVIVGFGFYFNYGITISKKKVKVVYINALKIFSYDDVTRITVHFCENWIYGEIKVKDTPTYTFDFDEFSISGALSYLPKSLWTVKLKIRKKDVEKYLQRSAWCDKIQIVNRVEDDDKKEKI